MQENFKQKMFDDLAKKEIFKKALEYAFEYSDTVRERNVYPTQEAIANLGNFDEQFPDKIGNAQEIIQLLHQFGSPATVTQTGGRYFGLVNGGVVPAGLAAKLLNDFWDQNTPLYVTSPIVSKLESIVERWLRKIFHLPDETVAGFVSGSSMAILCGLAAARYRVYQRLGWDVNQKGLVNAPKIRIVTGKHVHGTVIKAIALLGFGKDCIEWVNVDAQGRIIVDEIPELDAKTILILQAGNVNSGAFDDFEAICDKANQAGAWVHIDGAIGLWAAGSDKLKHLTQGIEKADSWAVDGHKTLNTPYDCGITLCRDREALILALQTTGSYIEYGEQRDGMLYTPEMSRRARAVELWATLKYLGMQGLDQLVTDLHEKAVRFAEGLTQNGFTILNEVVFNQVIVCGRDDQETNLILQNLQELRKCWCGGSSWFDKKIIRISVCSWATTNQDIDTSVASFVQAREMIKQNNV